MRGVSAILTASMHKITEQGTYKADVTFLFSVYTFLRCVGLLEGATAMTFERFVDLMHGKKFKFVRAGSGTACSSNKTTSITPEIFILQIDLLTSYFKSSGSQEEAKEAVTDTSEKNHFCPLYQVIFNVCRFVNSKRW